MWVHLTVNATTVLNSMISINFIIKLDGSKIRQKDRTSSKMAAFRCTAVRRLLFNVYDVLGFFLFLCLLRFYAFSLFISLAAVASLISISKCNTLRLLYLQVKSFTIWNKATKNCKRTTKEDGMMVVWNTAPNECKYSDKITVDVKKHRWRRTRNITVLESQRSP